MFQQVPTSCDHIKLENDTLKFWKDNDSFNKLRAKNAGKPKWSFLDGPITANNPMGVHHAWGRTLKDCFQRYNAMLGKELRYQNGFDCQGLWVEVEVEKQLGTKCKADIEKYGLEEFINTCKSRVAKYSAIQTQQSIRLGYWMDWDNSYYTISDENNYTIWSFLKKCHTKGLVYKGLDAMPWCPRCETGISEQERREGYKTVTDTAVFVKFPLIGRAKESILIWTTTPWTLPANVAAAVNPELSYVKVSQNGEYIWLAETLTGILKEKGKFEVVETVKGAAMVGWEYAGPFDDNPVVSEVFGEAGYKHRIVPWTEVAADSGVGIVHIAPGCGKEDFDLGKELGIPMLMPIDDNGIYQAGYGFLTGQSVFAVADQILDKLREKELYYKKEQFSHEYPHCWRCSTPLVFRSVDEWYINMKWRNEIKQVVDNIRWIPEWGRDQEQNWLDNMQDWMISKKRFWGLALPIFECECGWYDVIGSKEELKERTVEGWDKFDGNSPHRPWIDHIRIKCPKCGNHVARIPDVGNPWLDAGIVPYSTMKYNSDRSYWEQWFPADLVLECFPGQFRNWFYALLAMSTMMEGKAPFKTLLGHALVRDEHGKEMHKSTGNAIWFDDAAEKMGADVMRWMYCSQNPTNNLNFGYTPGDQVRRRVFGTWWNVYSFFVNYARLDGFDATRELVAYDKLQDIDRWLLSKLQELIKVANQGLSEFNVALLIAEAERFIERLSNWYIRRNRRRYWRPKSDSDTDKLAAYQTLYRVLVDLCKILAPICPFVTEDMYQNLVRSVNPTAPESVHHTDYPQFDAKLYDEKIAQDMDMIADVVSRVLSIRENKKIRVRQPLATVTAVAGPAKQEALKRLESHILDELNIKELAFTTELGDYVTYTIKPNFKTLGTKVGKEMGKVRTLLAAANPAELAAKAHAGENFRLGDFDLAAEDILVEMQFDETLAVNDAGDPPVILDIKITPELLREGIARDMVRHIQQARKDNGLEIQNHITMQWYCDDDTIKKAIAEHGSYISRETLCDSMTETAAPADAIELELETGKLYFTIAVK